jgi:uncharacterized protein
MARAELPPRMPAQQIATPVREFILKVAARCNLDCAYCYEYRHGDESWRSASKFMAPVVYETTARKIADHIVKHDLKEISVALHGGEPLLLGPARLDRLAGSLRKSIAPTGAELVLSMQTNATLITKEIAQVIHAHGIHVGVSLDGDKIANDRHRLDHRGVSSFDRVIAGINTLRAMAPGQPAGILAVVDIENDPIETFDALASLGITNIDLLLPHYNWDRPPPRSPAEIRPAYGQWFGRIWDAWLGGRHSEMRIRFLDNIVARLVGHPGLYEQMSESPVALITINSDGAIEGVDTLKSTGTGVQKTGLNVLDHSIDDVLSHQLYLSRQDWKAALPDACGNCDIKRICAGGYLPHRYRAGTGFNNTSVYCDDLFHLVTKIDKDIRTRVGKG